MKSEKPSTRSETTGNDELVPEGWSVVEFDPEFNEANNYRPWCSEQTPGPGDGAP